MQLAVADGTAVYAVTVHVVTVGEGEGRLPGEPGLPISPSVVSSWARENALNARPRRPPRRSEPLSVVTSGRAMIRHYLHELNSMIPAGKKSDYELVIEIKIVVGPSNREKL